MNKLYFTLALFLLLNFRADAQLEGLYQFSHNYFRSDPFQGQFSTFMEHLMKDPGISNKEKRLRSDTALFYFYGIYTQFNPFFFKPSRVEVLLEELPFKYSDSLPARDTMLVYQLIAYGKKGESEKEIKKEFEKIHRRSKGQFASSNYREFKENNTVTGAVHNYFTTLSVVAPVSIVWGAVESTGEPVLSIVLRFRTSENMAVLPTAAFHYP